MFVDQRGTGHSEPEFRPELSEAIHKTFYEALPEAKRRARVRRAMIECRDRMVASGVDIGAYNSATSARDLADLRIALGYDEWNLYGASMEPASPW